MRALPHPDGLPRAWRWDTASNVLVEQTFDLSHGAHVVVTSGAGCQFCEALASALPKEPSLAHAFADHAVWIARPDSAWNQDAMRDWDRRHPQVRLLTVFDLSPWPHPDIWSTPFFYFIRDGRVVKVVRGYLPERVDELRAGFQGIGVGL